MGHGHAHSAADADRAARAVSRRNRRRLTATAAALAALTAAGLVVLWPRGDVGGEVAQLGLVKDVYQAQVTRAVERPCRGTAGSAQEVRCLRARFVLEQGPDRGEARTIEFARTTTTPDLEPGDTVVLNHVPGADPGFDYTYSDRQRRPVLLWLTLLFAAAVVALGRWRGLGALVGLGASIFVILQFVLPSIVDGHNPPLVAIVGASAVAYLALYLAYGFRTMTTVALLSTLGALALTVGLATLFTELAQFSGLANEDALLVGFGATSVDLQGLVLAGMVLGALGALDDVTVTQSSAVAELRLADPALSRRALYRAGLRIGRDHVASTVNTLALAYAGASLPLLILFSLSGQSLGTVANGEAVAVTIVSALVGSIGLVAGVPISTGLAALVAPPGRTDRARRRPPPAATQSEVVAIPDAG